MLLWSKTRLRHTVSWLSKHPKMICLLQNVSQFAIISLQYVVSVLYSNKTPHNVAHCTLSMSTHLQHTFSMLLSSAIRLGHTVSWLSKHSKMTYPLRNVYQLVIFPCNTLSVRCLCPVWPGQRQRTAIYVSLRCKNDKNTSLIRLISSSRRHVIYLFRVVLRRKYFLNTPVLCTSLLKLKQCPHAHKRRFCFTYLLTYLLTYYLMYWARYSLMFIASACK